MIECDTLADNYWVDSFWKYRRYNDDDLGCSVGWVTSLRPVGVSTPVDTSFVPMLECLVLLELSDRYFVLIFHTISLRDFSGRLKPESQRGSPTEKGSYSEWTRLSRAS